MAKKDSIAEIVRKRIRSKKNDALMTVVNPAPPPVLPKAEVHAPQKRAAPNPIPPPTPPPPPVPPGCYSKTIAGKDVIVCPPKDIAAPTLDPFEARIPFLPMMRTPRPQLPRRPKRSKPTMRPRHVPTFPGGVHTCSESCYLLYPGNTQFQEWQGCYDRCNTLYMGGHTPNPGMPPKLGGQALRQRSDAALELLLHMQYRDNAAIRDSRTGLAIRALKTANTSQERREAITIARSLIADWNRTQGGQRFYGQGAFLAAPVSADDVRLVAQGVPGQTPQILVCGKNNCCVLEKPSDLWRCIREIRTTKVRAKNPIDTLCHCDGPNNTDCKCTVCWQKKRGAIYKPSCITFGVPDQPSSGGLPPPAPLMRTVSLNPARRRHMRHARSRAMMRPFPRFTYCPPGTKLVERQRPNGSTYVECMPLLPEPPGPEYPP